MFDDNNKIVFIIVILYQKIEKWNIKGDRVSFHKLFINRSPSYSVPPHSFFTGSVKELKMEKCVHTKKLFFIIYPLAHFLNSFCNAEKDFQCVFVSRSMQEFLIWDAAISIFFMTTQICISFDQSNSFIGFISQYRFHIFCHTKLCNF